MAAIKAVVYDIGNVLIEWNPERYYDAEIGEARRRALFQAVDLYEMNQRVDFGENLVAAMQALAADHQEYHTEIMMWRNLWSKDAVPAIAHSVRLMRALQTKRVPVFALSNFGVQSFEMVEGFHRFLREFDQRYVSGYLKLIKPDAAIYQALERGCGLPPEGLLFVDDSADNITAAAARGWQVHHFEGSEGWASSLVSHGLLTRKEAGL